MQFDVMNRFTGRVQFTAEIECGEDAARSLKLRLAVLWAIKSDANLRGANLSDANLRGANLSDANLSDADLSDADLSDANLSDADLSDADLSYANLRGADLSYANLSYANLRGANLRGANLRGANLSHASGIAGRVIAGGIRSDGYSFLLTRTGVGPWRIKAGCRNLTLQQAQDHWDRTRPVGTPLGDETRLIINHMVAVAKLRGWPEETTEG